MSSTAPTPASDSLDSNLNLIRVALAADELRRDHFLVDAGVGVHAHWRPRGARSERRARNDRRANPMMNEPAGNGKDAVAPSGPRGWHSLIFGVALTSVRTRATSTLLQPVSK